ncbi:uncharacterized protein M421DRAFT_94952 [Didymella exigua CBS 183.55]|uniref:Uncharacterized protein n=1 Tax=Didymella exigua CBS 183.55 TaxID=1150837 RepID=A0A6A5RCY0_9PLEO|nr:uncharacterized protein M421DRAFT_94952 [Didymella exigua CBS 183.55]KAF1925150.1 hypothetical protein M421DRAFT_94952 [Didymella exigua CBS 183.55]
MRSFQAVIVFLFALVASVFAAEAEFYDATVYITSTVYRVNTVTMSGSPSGSVANQTSTISAPSYAAPSVTASAATASAVTVSYGTSNGTAVVKPTGSATQSGSTPEFTGAASSLSVNALVVALVAGASYLAL